MKRLVISFFLILTAFLFFVVLYNKNKIKEYSKTYSYFNGINIKVYTNKNIKNIFSEIEQILKKYELLTSRTLKYKNNIYSINKNEYTKIPNELYELLLFGQEVYNKTNGYININKGNITDIYEKSKDQKIKPIYNNMVEKVVIENNQIKGNNINIDLEPILKLYIGNIIKEKLESNNITSYIINMASSSIIGNSMDEFTVGIEKPYSNSLDYIAILKLKNVSISTVGPYQNYYTINEKIYHNLINLKTLKQVDNYQSITVVSKDPLEAQILSYYLYFLSIDEGKEILKEYSAEAIWYKDNKIEFTDGIKNYQK